MRVLLVTALLVAVASPPALADDLPVREVTVFKDGHAFVLRQGKLPVGASGHITLDELPTPVLGTFWPFAKQPGAKLRAVKAGTHRVQVEQTALVLTDLLAANIGAEVIVTDAQDRTFHAKIVGVPTRSAEELADTSPPGTAPQLPKRGGLVLLEMAEGLKAMFLDQVRHVVFRGAVARRSVAEEMRHRLTLELDWEAGAAPTAEVGMLYLQKGLRWIPSYRVDLEANGKARLRLQGTLVNDLADLKDVGVNLVIGVPTFTFAHMVDPISMQQAIAQVAHHIPRQAITGQLLSNAIMTRAVAPTHRQGGGSPAGGASGQPDAARTEDLYVFHVPHVTLSKGERLVVSVADVTLPYENVYTLELPFSPPPDVWPQIAHRMQQNRQEVDAARLLAAPKVQHKIRLMNKSPHPITTAPALVLKDGHVLAQGMLTYTSVGGSVDLPVTAAIDVKAKKSDGEVERVSSAARWRGDAYARIGMKGTVRLTNYKKETVHLEVKRFVIGTSPSAENEGSVRLLNALEDTMWTSWTPPVWWRWYNWPNWWYHFNGVAEISWDVHLEPGKTIELGYAWSYYWR